MEVKDTVEAKYVLYARKSSESDEKQALSIDAQVKEMTDLAERQGLYIADVRKESHSAKAVGQRPIFNSVLEDIRNKKFDGILSWAPDRLSRNAGDLGAVVDLMDQGVLQVVQTHGQRFTDNPNEKFLLMILGSQAKLENDQKGINVKRGLRARCEQGLWPAPAPTGYLNHPDRDKKCHVIIDKERAPIMKQMFERVAYDGWSGRKIYYWLKEIRFTGPTGKSFTLSSIYRLLKLDFYYGRFEYPRDSGNWYEGKHIPLISKELFDRTQLQLESQRSTKNNHKEFAFTRLMICGRCGSGITAQEKYKKQQNGNVHHYIYYNCTQSRDKRCREKYIREKDLVKQLIEMIDDIDVVKSGLKKKLKDEMERYTRFQAMMGKDVKKPSASSIDIKNYAKYVLENGTIFEKREVMECFKSRLILRDRKIILNTD